jgi:hypothetical protein
VGNAHRVFMICVTVEVGDAEPVGGSPAEGKIPLDSRLIVARGKSAEPLKELKMRFDLLRLLRTGGAGAGKSVRPS